MIKDLEKILIVDIEATCWEGEIPKNQFSEVIEFGVSVVDVKSGKIEESVGILVKPTSSEISEFCTKLTTITPDLVEKEGILFKQACQFFLQHSNKSKKKCSLSQNKNLQNIISNRFL